jgi:tripartite-type tricarboxylate transporter receptor subunit TctC
MSGTKVSRRGFMAASTGLGVALACPSIVRAASYATQPIRLFVGTGAAGTNDLVARLIAPVLKEELGQPVLVENRPGAATTLALGLVSKARPDGHTLLVSSGAAVAVHVTSVTKPADLIKDLSHVGMICDGAYTYAVNAQVAAKDAKGFIELLKKEPGKIRYGGTGPGGTIHLSGELFCLRTGTKMTVVQYTNAGMRASDLLANETQLGIGGIGVLGQHIKSGALRGLFVAGEQREPLFPDLPTSVELGIKDLESITNWFGLHGPKGMPDQIVRQLNAALAKAIAHTEVRNVLGANGMFVSGGPPEALVARMNKDHKVLSEVAEAANIRVE